MPSTMMPTRKRDDRLDALRGLALVCMLFDHAALAAALCGRREFLLLRLFPGRLAMPLFFLVAGSVAGRYMVRVRRVLLIGVVGVVASAGWACIGVPQADILLIYVGVVLLWVSVPCRGVAPLVVLVLALLQSQFLRVPWDNFQPGLCFAFYVLGVRLRHEVGELGAMVPVELAAVGRWPLTFYGAQLCAVLLTVVLCHR